MEKLTREQRKHRFESPLVSRPVKISRVTDGSGELELNGLPDNELHHVFKEKPDGWKDGDPVPPGFFPFCAIAPKPANVAAVQVRIPFRFNDWKGQSRECAGGDYLVLRADGGLDAIKRFEFEESYDFVSTGVRRTNPATAEERMDAIMRTLRNMPTKEQAGVNHRLYYRNDGTPDALYLTAYLGFQVSAEERDEAWSLHQAQISAMKLEPAHDQATEAVPAPTAPLRSEAAETQAAGGPAAAEMIADPLDAVDQMNFGGNSDRGTTLETAGDRPPATETPRIAGRVVPAPEKRSDTAPKAKTGGKKGR